LNDALARIFFFPRQTIFPLTSSYGKGIMKNNIFIFSFVLLISSTGMGQKDSIPIRSLVEKGAAGDILLGKETRKAQLLGTPQRLQMPDSAQEKDIHLKKKKAKHKKPTN
jgi:hypothetical protein